ncbi:MAG: hypothetical protein AAF965_07320 [Pseudomonadota bacterium]
MYSYLVTAIVMLSRVSGALRFVFAVGIFVLPPAFLTAQTLGAEVQTAHENALRYTDLRTAKRAGWRPFGGEAPLMGRHYEHPDNPDYTTGDKLDWTKPSNLVYSTINGREQLVALAWVVRISPGDPMPSGFSGRRDIWHVHDTNKIVNALQETRPVIGSLAKWWQRSELQHKDGRTQLAMVHLWLIPNPKGRFASHNPALTYRDHGLPLDWADTDMEAARGLAMAEPKGCDDLLDAEMWLGGVSWATQSRLKRSCRSLARQVEDALGGSEREVKGIARAAYRRMEDLQLILLSDAERRRIATLVEDGPGVCR